METDTDRTGDRPPAYSFRRPSRNSRTVTILIVVYAVLLSLIILFDAAWWLIGLMALTTLPAIWDVFSDSTAGLELNGTDLRWFSGKRDGHLPLGDIDYFRFDTRWDFSVRVSAVLTNGKKVRLPDESVPAHRLFENTLIERGFRVERHHFRIF